MVYFTNQECSTLQPPAPKFTEPSKSTTPTKQGLFWEEKNTTRELNLDHSSYGGKIPTGFFFIDSITSSELKLTFKSTVSSLHHQRLTSFPEGAAVPKLGSTVEIQGGRGWITTPHTHTGTSKHRDTLENNIK